MASLQVLGSDKALRLNNFNTLGLVQSFDWAPNFNAQDTFELGRTTRLDTAMELETSGSFQLTSSGNLAGVLARMMVLYNAGSGAFEGFEFNSVASGAFLGSNGYSYDQDDFTRVKMDLVLHEKTEQSLFNRSTYLACAYPTTISGRVDTSGAAQDTINWSGLFAVGFPSPYHDIVATPVTRASGTTMTVPAAYSATTHTLAYVTIDGVPYRTLNTDAIYATYATTVITMVGGFTIPTGVVMTACFYKTTTPNTVWSTVHSPTTVGAGATAVYGIRGYQANVYIAPANSGTPVSSEQWLRVQSLDYSIDLRMEALRQIAVNAQGTTIYHRAPTYPLNMTVNATVYETEWADWKAMLTKSFPGNSLYQDVYEFAPNYLKTSFAVVIHYFTKGGTKIQDLIFGDVRVDGFGSRINVGGRAEITWTLRGSQVTVNGYNIA